MGRDSSGRFARQREPWTPERWDDGYINGRPGKERFRVYRPDYPRCWTNGYAFRAHVVWWLETGEVVPPEKELHHRDEDRLNDRFSNLEILSNSDHQKVHKGSAVSLVCENCEKTFYVPRWRARKRTIRFCSQRCYHEHPRSSEHRKGISSGLTKAYAEGLR